MNLPEMIAAMLTGTREIGTFTLHELLAAADGGKITGLAVEREGEGTVSCLAFIRGEPEGAVFSDGNGDRFGDTAVMLILGRKTFTFFEVPQDIVEAFVMGCRIFEKAHLGQGITHAIPEIGRKSQGIGHLTIIIRRDNALQKGIRVSIRKDGKVVGSDVTSGDGSAGFRAMYGDYDCIVQDRDGQVRSFSVHFTETDPDITLEW